MNKPSREQAVGDSGMEELIGEVGIDQLIVFSTHARAAVMSCIKLYNSIIYSFDLQRVGQFLCVVLSPEIKMSLMWFGCQRSTGTLVPRLPLTLSNEGKREAFALITPSL